MTATTNLFVLASNNEHKWEEISKILSCFDIKLTKQKDAGVCGEAEENGSTFEENAILKAKYAFEKTKRPVIADDSGLSVEALNGMPGIFSARYAENDKERINRILQELKDIPAEKRNAKFVCVLAVMLSDKEIYTVRGEVCGKIAFAPKGAEGFGYDPIFIPEGFDKSFSELGNDIKNTISHRANALSKLKNLLETLNF